MDLKESRTKIEKIDKEMAKLFEERLDAVREIASYKKQNALPIYDELREKQLIEKNTQFIENTEYLQYYTKFLKDLMNVSKSFQEKIVSGIKVVYCGTNGAFAHIATKKAFPNAQIFSCQDFASAYKGVEDGEYDCAVLPIENSFAGDVSTVMDLMFSGSLYINRVIELGVSHNLLGKKGSDISKIKTVVSHAQALEQCVDFIREHNLNTLTYSNTALAGEYVSKNDDESVAAIASLETAKAFDLEILQTNINTSNTNTTRFGVFTRAQSLPNPDSQNENEHFILTFTTKNQAGSLAQALDIIGAHGFNMRSLHSRPMKELLWSYYFLIEAEGNVNTRNGREMLQELSAVSSRLKLVGTYN